jgi:hypothetical protein
VRRLGRSTVRTWRDWPSIARAIVVVVAVKVCLRVAPMRLMRVAARGTGAHSPHALMLAGRLFDQVASLGRVRLLMTDCLSRSLSVLFLARVSGAELRMVIGVRRTGTSLDAHAWLECGGTSLPMNGPARHTRIWATP